MKTSESESQSVTWFIRNHDRKAKSRPASCNESKRIGRESSSPIYRTATIEHLFVRIVGGSRAAVELGFSSGPQLRPSDHRYLWDVQHLIGDSAFLGHQELWASASILQPVAARAAILRFQVDRQDFAVELPCALDPADHAGLLGEGVDHRIARSLA